MKLLFLCSRNHWRSPTAEAVYRKDARLQVRSAGVSQAARVRVTEKLLLWADLICVMENWHKKRLLDDFPHLAGQLDVEVLDIDDDYPFMDPVLMDLIRARVEPLIESWQPPPDDGDLEPRVME